MFTHVKVFNKSNLKRKYRIVQKKIYTTCLIPVTHVLKEKKQNVKFKIKSMYS